MLFCTLEDVSRLWEEEGVKRSYISFAIVMAFRRLALNLLMCFDQRKCFMQILALELVCLKRSYYSWWIEYWTRLVKFQLVISLLWSKNHPHPKKKKKKKRSKQTKNGYFNVFSRQKMGSPRMKLWVHSWLWSYLLSESLILRIRILVFLFVKDWSSAYV